MTDLAHAIVVIGGGRRAKAALAERAALGSDCLWTGCVPSKALIAF